MTFILQTESNRTAITPTSMDGVGALLLCISASVISLSSGSFSSASLAGGVSLFHSATEKSSRELLLALYQFISIFFFYYFFI
jgi:S-formylglutathione hydrolase FrmB